MDMLGKVLLRRVGKPMVRYLLGALELVTTSLLDLGVVEITGAFIIVRVHHAQGRQGQSSDHPVLHLLMP